VKRDEKSCQRSEVEERKKAYAEDAKIALRALR